VTPEENVQRVRERLRSVAGADDDTVVFAFGGLAWGFNVEDLTAEEAEAYLDLQQRTIVGVLQDERGELVGFVFEGGPPNMVRSTGDGVQLGYTGREEVAPANEGPR
jgi:hypothetical protein